MDNGQTICEQIIHPQTGNQENAFAISAYGEIRTHSQVQLESIAKKKHNCTETDDMDCKRAKSDNSSVIHDHRSELHSTRYNDEMELLDSSSELCNTGTNDDMNFLSTKSDDGCITQHECT